MCKRVYVIIIIALISCYMGFTNATPVLNLHYEDLLHKDAWLSNRDGYDRARAFSNRYAIYAVYSANVYDESTDIYPEIFLPTNEFNEEVLHFKGDIEGTGFRGKAWLRYRYGLSQPHKPILVIAFRGTENLTDYLLGNFVVFDYGGEDQFKSAKKYTSLVIKHLEDRGLEYSKIVFTGHSLGGGLAEFMQRITNDSEAVVFMPSPNNGFLYSLTSGDERKNMNTTRIYEKGEILNFLRYLVSHDYTADPWPDSDDEIKTAWINFFKWSLFADHGIRDFAMKMLLVADLEGNCSARNILENIKKEYKLPMQLNKNERHRLACADGNNEVENQLYPLREKKQ